jgi:hypothetical protein
VSIYLEERQELIREAVSQLDGVDLSALWKLRACGVVLVAGAEAIERVRNCGHPRAEELAASLFEAQWYQPPESSWWKRLLGTIPRKVRTKSGHYAKPVIVSGLTGEKGIAAFDGDCLPSGLPSV